MQHPDFQIRNPNRARSLVSSFCSNPAAFHRADASGYVFWSERVLELDSFNPQVAARLASSFSQWKRFDAHRQELMRAELVRIQATQTLSKDTYEVVTRCLK
jgi:aminopeptidase N